MLSSLHEAWRRRCFTAYMTDLFPVGTVGRATRRRFWGRSHTESPGVGAVSFFGVRNVVGLSVSTTGRQSERLFELGDTGGEVTSRRVRLRKRTKFRGRKWSFLVDGCAAVQTLELASRGSRVRYLNTFSSCPCGTHTVGAARYGRVFRVT